MQYLLRSKKVTRLLLVLMLSPVIAFTQERYLNLEDHDEKSFHFGINIGVNRAHYSFTHHPRFLEFDSVMVVESINSTGINLAWLVNKRLSNHFDLRTYPINLVFTEKAFQYHLKYPNKPAGEDSVGIRKVQGITLAFPLQIKFNSDRINNFKVYMVGGIKYDIDLASNSGSRNAENLIKLKKADFGAELGIGFNFFMRFVTVTPEIRFSNGFSNLHDRDPNLKYSNVLDKLYSRMILFSIHLEE